MRALPAGDRPPVSRVFGDEGLVRGAAPSEPPVRLVSPGLRFDETFVLERPGGRSVPSRGHISWVGLLNACIMAAMLLVVVVVKWEWPTSAGHPQTNSGTVELAPLPPSSDREGFVQPAPTPVVQAATPSRETQPRPAAPPEAEPQPEPLRVQPQLDRETIAVMVKRGSDLMASGDFAAARVVLQRAAEAGDAEAALALAKTYDPVILRKLKVYGFAPDPAKARDWYDRAKRFGSAAAPEK